MVSGGYSDGFHLTEDVLLQLLHVIHPNLNGTTHLADTTNNFVVRNADEIFGSKSSLRPVPKNIKQAYGSYRPCCSHVLAAFDARNVQTQQISSDTLIPNLKHDTSGSSLSLAESWGGGHCPGNPRFLRFTVLQLSNRMLPPQCNESTLDTQNLLCFDSAPANASEVLCFLHALRSNLRTVSPTFGARNTRVL